MTTFHYVGLTNMAAIGLFTLVLTVIG